MTSGDRIRRGALRLGSVIAVVVFLAGAGTALFEAHDDIDKKVDTAEQARCLMDLDTPTLKVRKSAYREDEFLFKENGCPGPAVAASELEIRALAGLPRPLFISVMLRDAGRGIAISLGAALAILSISWGIGWAIAGFTADA